MRAHRASENSVALIGLCVWERRHALRLGVYYPIITRLEPHCPLKKGTGNSGIELRPGMACVTAAEESRQTSVCQCAG